MRLSAALILSLLALNASAAPFTVTDIENRTVTFENQPQSFVVANYIANFMMVGGSEGLGKVKALTKDGWEETRYGEYTVFTYAFPSMKTLPSIGGYHDDVLNAEKILSLKPDVLLIGRTQFAENNQRIALFEKAGIKVVVLDYHAMKTDNHTKSTSILGKLLGREAVAEEQNRTYKESLDHVYKTIEALPESAKNKRVYIEIGNKGVSDYGNSYSKDVLWGSILNNLKAKNLAADSVHPYMALDREYVLAGNPEVIFIGGSIWRNTSEGDQMRMGFTVEEADARKRLKAFTTRSGWSRLKAVKTNEVYAVDHGSLRNMADFTLTEYMAKILYPEAFKDLNPEKHMADFYKKYLPELSADGTFMIRLDGK